MYECHGWTDKFQLFQFSFSSALQSSKSVRPYGGQQKKEKKKIHVQTRQKHRSDRRWYIQWQKKLSLWRPVAQSDGNLNVRTDGLRPSVQRLKKITNKHKTEKHTENLGVYIWRWNFHQIYLTLNLWQKRIKRDRWHNSRANRYRHITSSQYAMQCNAMQCNTMQYNAMQCNEMQYSNAIQLQCNAMQSDNHVRKSVRPYGMKSVKSFFFTFFFFFSQYAESVSMYGTQCHGWTRQVSVFSCQYVQCHGWTDKFQLFQFSFSRIQSRSLSVRTEVPKKKEKKNASEQTQKHRSDRR
jgi:hypothetical protein